MKNTEEIRKITIERMERSFVARISRLRSKSNLGTRELAEKISTKYPLKPSYIQNHFINGIESGHGLWSLSRERKHYGQIFDLYLEETGASKKEEDSLKGLIKKFTNIDTEIFSEEDLISLPERVRIYGSKLQKLPENARVPIENLIDFLYEKHHK